MTWQDVKHALLSIVIGACVAFITTLMQGVLDWLQTIPTEVPATLAALTKYGHYLLNQPPPPHA